MFNYKIEHRPGTKHSNADGMSRPVRKSGYDKYNECLKTDNTESKVMVTNTKTPNWLPTYTNQELVSMQENDNDIGPILKLILNNTTKPESSQVKHLNKNAKILLNQWELLEIKKQPII